MATLEDIKGSNIVDTRFKEYLIWNFQETGDYDFTVSFGPHGVYATQLINAKGGYALKNGELSKTRLPFYITTNSQLETVNVTYLDGEVIKSGNGKTTVTSKAKGHMEIAREFIGMIEYDSKKPVSYIGNWQALWRMACALYLGFAKIADIPANMPKAKVDFAKANWQSNSPSMLRKLWENEATKAAKAAKAAKPQKAVKPESKPVEVKAESVEKVTA